MMISFPQTGVNKQVNRASAWVTPMEREMRFSQYAATYQFLPREARPLTSEPIRRRGSTRKAREPAERAPSRRSFDLQRHLVYVAPAPVLSGFEGGHDRVMAGAEMLGGVLVLGIVAAADVAAGAAQPKMHPGVAHGEAFLAAGGIGRAGQDELEMAAFRCHGDFLDDRDHGQRLIRPLEIYAATVR